jgi:hypothetical protein
MPCMRTTSARLHRQCCEASFLADGRQLTRTRGAMPSITDDTTGKAPGHGQAGRYLPTGLGVSGVSGAFYLVDKRIPWWGLLLWGTFALAVILIQSVIPQKSQDRRRVIQTIIISRLITKSGFDQAPNGSVLAHRPSSREEDIC